MFIEPPSQLVGASGETLPALNVGVVGGQSNSAMEAKSTVPPLLSIAPVASAASRVFSDPSRSEAEKTRKEIGSRSWPSPVAISPEGCVVGP